MTRVHVLIKTIAQLALHSHNVVGARVLYLVLEAILPLLYLGPVPTISTLLVCSCGYFLYWNIDSYMVFVGPVIQTNCSAFADCETCTPSTDCVWCASSLSCVAGNSSGPSSVSCPSWSHASCMHFLYIPYFVLYLFFL